MFKNLRSYCKGLKSLDICDNFVKGPATTELASLIKEVESMRNINLSDALNEKENEEIIESFEKSPNRNWEKIGFNFA